MDFATHGATQQRSMDLTIVPPQLPYIDTAVDVDSPGDFDSDDSLSQKNRREPPSPDQWRAIRPIFEDLYINQGMRLQDVQRQLLQQHQFYATYAAPFPARYFFANHY
jgi:hypothetical protein